MEDAGIVFSYSLNAESQDFKWHSIERTWDDHQARPGEVARVGLACTPEALLIAVDAPFHADPPPPGAPGRTDELWNYEVVEVFLLGAGHRYLELEVAPHRHLFLEFAGRRRRVADDLPDVQCASGLVEGGVSPRWWARLAVPRGCLPPPPRRFNLFACHGVGAERRWLAWRPQHLAAPDFHDPEPYAPLDLAW